MRNRHKIPLAIPMMIPLAPVIALKLLKGVILGITQGATIGLIKGDARSLDSSSCSNVGDPRMLYAQLNPIAHFSHSLNS